MLLKICDMLTTICQSFLFVLTCNNIVSKDNRISKFKLGILMVIVFMISMIFTHSGITSPYANLLMVIGTLLFIILFYRKSILDAFLGFGLSYSIVILSSYFIITFYQNIVVKFNFAISSEIQTLIFIFMPAWFIYILVYKYRKYFFDAIIGVKSLRPSLIFILLLNYALILTDTLRIHWQIEGMGELFKHSLYLISLMAFIFAIIYFAKINGKLQEVEMLNSALNDKIIELKKLKHDYGSEISSLYGLYQLGKVDRIGELLKNIVERYQSLNTTINVSVQATPIVASVLHSAVSASIDVIVFDSADYENLNITDNDLLKVLSNIINNSRDALRDVQSPIIKFKSYNGYNGVIITIINNGPEIPKEIRNRIFESGFSTKENTSGDRGYGLNIVSNIISQCNGRISVESNKQWTQFKIEIPYKEPSNS
ncbi:ATP-binding protein [uncultured Clostridium sp.]|uniref:sensor histidine kinase n=1 Tax=uncultured Clostridium sp. TaxID=59620 RepID=UPI0028EF1376|nr:ATP-binding protein [uncultured Clostridium sp.]